MLLFCFFTESTGQARSRKDHSSISSQVLPKTKAALCTNKPLINLKKKFY
jgi:hypothetical protein